MDCSTTNRKGCNYCLKSKDIGNNEFTIRIFAIGCGESTELYIENHASREDKLIFINYCPLCGKRLKSHKERI